MLSSSPSSFRARVALLINSCFLIFLLPTLSNAFISDEPVCGTVFTDPESKAYLADVVFEGIVSGLSETTRDRYNATFNISRVIKGSIPLAKSGQTSDFVPIIVGPFLTVADQEHCVGSVSMHQLYVVYVRERKLPKVPFYRTSAFVDRAERGLVKKIKKVICDGCAEAPRVRVSPKSHFLTGRSRGFSLRCKLERGRPTPRIVWLKDGQIVNVTQYVTVKTSRKSSHLRVHEVDGRHLGRYTCNATNVLGSSAEVAEVTSDGTVRTRNPSKDASSRVRDQVECPISGYCLNGGNCYYFRSLGTKFCKCPEKFMGHRCQYRSIFLLTREWERNRELDFDRTTTVAGLVIIGLVLIIIFIAAYCLSRKRRAQIRRRKEQEARRKRDEVIRAATADVEETPLLSLTGGGGCRSVSCQTVAAQSASRSVQVSPIEPFPPSKLSQRQRLSGQSSQHPNSALDRHEGHPGLSSQPPLQLQTNSPNSATPAVRCDDTPWLEQRPSRDDVITAAQAMHNAKQQQLQQQKLQQQKLQQQKQLKLQQQRFQQQKLQQQNLQQQQKLQQMQQLQQLQNAQRPEVRAVERVPVKQLPFEEENHRWQQQPLLEQKTKRLPSVDSAEETNCRNVLESICASPNSKTEAEIDKIPMTFERARVPKEMTANAEQKPDDVSEQLKSSAPSSIFQRTRPPNRQQAPDDGACTQMNHTSAEDSVPRSTKSFPDGNVPTNEFDMAALFGKRQQALATSQEDAVSEVEALRASEADVGEFNEQRSSAEESQDSSADSPVSEAAEEQALFEQLQQNPRLSKPPSTADLSYSAPSQPTEEMSSSLPWQLPAYLNSTGDLIANQFAKFKRKMSRTSEDGFFPPDADPTATVI